MKKLFAVLAAAIVTASFFLSCDLFGIVPDIQPTSLENAEYTALPANETEAMDLMSAAVASMGIGIAGGLGDEIAASMGNIDTKTVLTRMISPYLPPDHDIIQTPKTITSSGEIGERDVNVTFSIKNETIDGSVTGGSGSARIDSFVVKVKGGTSEDYSTGDASGSANGAIEFDKYIPYSGSPEITDGKIDVLADLSADFAESADSLSVSYDASLTVKAGLSISGEVGGKIVFSFVYKDNNSITINDTVADEAAIINSVFENVQMTATLEVYDNDNGLQESYSWDQDDLLQLYAEQLEELY